MGRGIGAMVSDYDGDDPPFWDRSGAVTHEYSQETMKGVAQRIGEEEEARQQLLQLPELFAEIEELKAAKESKAPNEAEIPSTQPYIRPGQIPEPVWRKAVEAHDGISDEDWDSRIFSEQEFLEAYFWSREFRYDNGELIINTDYWKKKRGELGCRRMNRNRRARTD